MRAGKGSSDHPPPHLHPCCALAGEPRTGHGSHRLTLMNTDVQWLGLPDQVQTVVIPCPGDTSGSADESLRHRMVRRCTRPFLQEHLKSLSVSSSQSKSDCGPQNQGPNEDLRKGDVSHAKAIETNIEGAIDQNQFEVSLARPQSPCDRDWIPRCDAPQNDANGHYYRG